ncbi:MAG: molybdopterin-binding protein [Rugosibacter sp.]|jgi:molybdopterin-biosynthesis enzyme MoeA-like protein|nr:molybdopterin-binding protein [Rugosibacter sp.]
MPVQSIGAIIIGDEITRGKRADSHFSKLLEILAVRGMHLDWAMYIGDDRQRLIDTFRRTLASSDIVFSFGGIGNTPDDHTRQAAAVAADVDLFLHPEAEHEIRARFVEMNRELTIESLDMARFPAGSQIIPNPFNRIAGFSLGKHYFVPGFPQMAWPMVEWVLDTKYRHLFNATPVADDAILVWGGVESLLIPLMLSVEEQFPAVKTFSLPFLGSQAVPFHVELGVRGEPEQVPPAMEMLRHGVVALGYTSDPRSAAT